MIIYSYKDKNDRNFKDSEVGFQIFHSSRKKLHKKEKERWDEKKIAFSKIFYFHLEAMSPWPSPNGV